VRHTVYNKNHLLHQILYETILAIEALNTSPLLADRIGRVLLHFPEVNRLKVNEVTFKKLKKNCKNAPYQLALQIAELILLNYRPDIKSGSRDLLAIMFDMNVLWEEYVYQVLRKYARSYRQNLTVLGQRKKEFWNRMHLKPDVIIETEHGRYILDTKWKLVTNSRPDDGDIKQMFSYNHLWKAKRSILLYPGESGKNLSPQPFKSKLFIKEEVDHTCQLGFVNVIDSIKDKKEFASSILEKMIEN
jgi:5-methylcytosine-specific restriction enzyme subunit McrC